jgi:serine protease Do
LQHLVANLTAKKTVEATVLRDGKTLKVPVTIEEQPEQFGTAQGFARPAPEQKQEAVGVAKVGLELVDLNEELANQLGYTGKLKGALISRVEPGSVAASAGLRRGMLLTRVDQTAVSDAAAAREALDRGSLQKGILLQVRAPQGGANFVLLQAAGG